MNKEKLGIMYKNGYLDAKSDNYIWLPEMELLMPEISNDRKSLVEDYLKIDDLVIFAINGSGDFYAWMNDENVIFVDCETGIGNVYASNLESAIFRRIVEFASGQYVDMCKDADKLDMDSDDSFYYISESEAKNLFKQYVKLLSGILETDWINQIEKFISNDFIDDCSFISYSECIDIINKYLEIKENKIDLNK